MDSHFFFFSTATAIANFPYRFPLSVSSLVLVPDGWALDVRTSISNLKGKGKKALPGVRCFLLFFLCFDGGGQRLLTVFSAFRVVARFDQLSQAYATRQAGHIWDVHSDGFQFFVLMPLWSFFTGVSQAGTVCLVLGTGAFFVVFLSLRHLN
jgi:hypothetical protein